MTATPTDIVIDGTDHPLLDPETGRPIPVLNWHETGIEFRPGDGYNKARDPSVPIELAVWHWTGGEAEPDRMANTLRRRKFGIEFAIGRDGVVWQFCDPIHVDTADAGFANKRSVGIEVVCYGFRGPYWNPRKWIVPKVAKDRPLRWADYRGKARTFADFYPRQYRAARALALLLSDRLPIAAQTLAHDSLTRHLDLQSREVVNGFSGHLAHYNISKNKLDCGPLLIEEFQRTFDLPAGAS